jgi:cytochrome o ubiquinol oxidase subunit 3
MSELAITSAQATEQSDNKATFGFWTYLMTDCVLFACLFATYAVLHNNTFGGPSGKDLFNLSFALTETLILLTSSFTCGLAVMAMRRGNKATVLLWLAVTYIAGLTFLVMELTEFSHLAQEGNNWQRSGFLSSFFTLVSTHGLHIAVGLLWIIVLAAKVIRQGLTRNNIRRLTMFSMFWHFLDIIWIFIFTIVYLMGGANV